MTDKTLKTLSEIEYLALIGEVAATYDDVPPEALACLYRIIHKKSTRLFDKVDKQSMRAGRIKS